MEPLFMILVGCGLLGTLVAAGVAAVRPGTAAHPSADVGHGVLGQRAAAHVDRGAAAELRRRLLEDLRRHEAVRLHIERGGGTRDREMASLLEVVDRSERLVRQQLADVEVWLQLER